jgi:DNA-binding NarL/FixJ family response regulator
MKTLRILIADDHDLMRRGVKALLQSHPGWEICGEAQTGREAVAKAQELRPDIAILDVSMPDLNGVDAGVRGYIVKSDSDRDLIIAVETLANHKPFLTPRATEVMLINLKEGRMGSSETPTTVGNRLTTREREVVQLLAEGKSSKEVASSLNISVKTAETHRANIMRKLQFHNLSELVRYAVRNQIVEA